ncbi:hypothetical protein ACLK17_12585 [Escherichia coli]
MVWAHHYRTGRLPFMYCIGAGWLRNHGYNKRMVAVAGDLAAGQMLMESFRNQPWSGF